MSNLIDPFDNGDELARPMAAGMENPMATRGYQDAIDKAKADPAIAAQVEAVISEVTTEHQAAIASRIAGTSLTSKIYHALSAKGLLTP